ncbi:glucose-6-phosphate dehydrogenase assembly protein OpcA [Puniceicoccaceae bacterium K14]|nr:glucose-6-phosphate dehydrogenase assembly protein OpcA [Puniceicoccaceae bacterium K14]
MAKSEIYNTLPGFEVPVGKALSELSKMWEAPAGSDAKAPSEYRASRMNLILHMGFECSVEQGESTFQTALEFSRRYPCRVIILCAQPDSWNDNSDMVCKIYSHCDIGQAGDGMSCCEVLTLGYTLSDRRFLENQVSIFLEADLPTYYWPVSFGSAQRLSDYQFFFKESQRVVLDAACDEDLLKEVEIPYSGKIHDLAYSRLLSIRQSIGQFMSSYAIESILDGLQGVEMKVPTSFSAEGKALLGWIQTVIDSCQSDTEVSFSREVNDKVEIPFLSFSYNNKNSLTCELNLSAGQGKIDAVFSGEGHSMTAGIRLLDPTETLAEAMFFA